MKKKFKLGVIGCGFMASSIISGILATKMLLPSEIIAADKSDSQFEKFNKLGITTTLSNFDVAENSEFLLFAIKPQSLDAVLAEIKYASPERIITILAGVKKSKIKVAFPNAKVARCMPNTPCSIGYGVVAIDIEDFTNTDKTFIQGLFAGIGETLLLNENKMNAVTGISGSGPAYVYLFINGLIEAGVKQGLTFDEAKILAVNTVIGSGNMVKVNKDKTIDDLITAVCSKGGTTIEAVNTFNELGLKEIIDKAVTACVNRAAELGGDVIKKPITKDNIEPNTFAQKKTLNSNEIIIYTDGACSGNPGAGGWSAILINGEQVKELSGGENNTTNNRMELKGVIEGLKALKKTCDVAIHTDSAYIENAFNKGWLKAWIENNWRTSSKEEVKNIDLWEQLIILTNTHNVRFIKVKGHSNDKYNNRCDELAVSEWKKLKN